jgi:hypothetical protein
MSKKIPEERLLELQRRLDRLPSRSSDRRTIIVEFAHLYSVSESSVYRALRSKKSPKSLRRIDAGKSRILPQSQMEQYCTVIAAMKFRTKNNKNHHLSTAEAIRILEDYGMETNSGFVKAPKNVLKKATVNSYLKQWGYNLSALNVEAAAVRFQASHSNDCWQFDLSPSDLKHLPEWPPGFDPKKRVPTLMLYSVVDDRSGVAYQEYHAVYGEDVEAALRFLYRAMSEKNIEGFPFQGIPTMIYTDNGPIARSLVFQRVLEYLGIELRTHLPKGKGGRKTTARAKGKVERAFRTIKELHESLYHYHPPQNIEEANQWLLNFVLRYNERSHRMESHSRIEDWLKKIPKSGLRKICPWERYTTFAREPEKRKVTSDAKVKVDGSSYTVDSTLAGQHVILWWGLFDSELYVEHDDNKYGPFHPDSGPIPLNTFKKYKKSKSEQRAESIEKLAFEMTLPRAALDEDSRTLEMLKRALSEETIIQPFHDSDPFQEFEYASTIEAKKAISEYLGVPLSKLPKGALEKIGSILAKTLKKRAVMQEIKEQFRKPKLGAWHVN